MTGGAGSDSQRYTLATGPVTVVVATMVTNSIEDVRGSASGEDILEGLAGGDTFTTSGTNAGALAACERSRRSRTCSAAAATTC